MKPRSAGHLYVRHLSMRAKAPSIYNLKSAKDAQDWLRSCGIEPDTRQDGWAISFGTFAITDQDAGKSVGEACVALKDHFISHANAIPFSSKVKSISYSPIISDMLPKRNEPIKIRHRHSQDNVQISVSINHGAWMTASSATRRQLLIDPLVSALKLVRKSWLKECDRDSLSRLFLSFLV
jgi:hypothetical protein